MGRVLLVLALLAWTARAAPWLHPKDGPDLDVLLRVEDDALVLRAAFNLAYLDAARHARAATSPRLPPDVVARLAADDASDTPRAPTEDEDPRVHAALADFLRACHTLRVDGAPVVLATRDVTIQRGAPPPAALYPAFGARALDQVVVLLETRLGAVPGRIDLGWTCFPPDLVHPAHDEAPASVPVHVRVLRGPREDALVLTEDAPSRAWHSDPAREDDGLASVPDVPPDAPPRAPLAALACGAVAAALVLRRPHGRARVLVAGMLLAVSGALLSTDALRTPLPFLDAGAPLLDEDAALAILRPLHANIYRAFDASAEDATYDVLARSVTGDLLDALYAEVRGSLVLPEHGAAVARVRAVRPVDAVVTSLDAGGARPGFRVDYRWQVDGIVRHWGHAHARTTESLARYTVRATSEGWRIAACEVLEQRVVSATLLDESEAPDVSDERGTDAHAHDASGESPGAPPPGRDP